MKLTLRSQKIGKRVAGVGLLILILWCGNWSACRQRQRDNNVLINAVYLGTEPLVESSLNGGANPNIYFDPSTRKALPEHSIWTALAGENTRKTLPSAARAPVLSLAITYLRKEAVEKLIDRGAGVNAPDDKGSAPIHYATQHNATDILITLLDHHADVNSKNKAGNTPLHLAVYNRNLPNIQVLLDRGAQVEAVNGEGLSSLDILSFQCSKLHYEWLVTSMTNRADEKQVAQGKINLHYKHQFDLLRPLIAVLEKNGAKPSEAAQHRFIDSFELNEHEIDEALK